MVKFLSIWQPIVNYNHCLKNIPKSRPIWITSFKWRLYAPSWPVVDSTRVLSCIFGCNLLWVASISFTLHSWYNTDASSNVAVILLDLQLHHYHHLPSYNFRNFWLNYSNATPDHHAAPPKKKKLITYYFSLFWDLSILSLLISGRNVQSDF